MNQPPAQHPLFVAITCLSLLAAWGTLDAEAVAADAVISSSRAAADDDRPPTLPIEPAVEADCLSRSGSQRALCIFAATRGGSASERAAPGKIGAAEPKPLKLAQKTSTPLRAERPLLDPSLLAR